MQLNKFTDYALRILMYISQSRELPYTIAEIAEGLKVSQNHLVKIVHFMSKQGWLITSRGKGGGVCLNPEVLNFQLGEVIRILQGDVEIVECNNPPCVLRPKCGLKGILNQAVESFYESLNQYTIADALKASPPPHNSKNSEVILLNL